MTFEILARSLNRGMAMSGNIMPRLLLGIAKLNLAAVFLWYAVDLLCELHKWNCWMFIVDTISLMALVGFCSFVFVIEFLTERWRTPAPSRGIGIGPFLLLVLIPISIVAAIGQWNQDPCLFDDADLLKFTVTQTRQIISKVWGS